MAGVFKLIRGSQRQLVERSIIAQRADPKALELQAAKEILAEIFGIRTSEVEEMIQSRFEETISNRASTASGLWPLEFCLTD